MNRIIGVTVGTPMKVPDWNQEDPNKADFIKNKPNVVSKEYVDGLVGDIESALNELHTYAQTLIEGGNE